MIKIILKNGSETTLAEWQKIYGLPVGSDAIGRHFSLKDAKIAENLAQYKGLVINELLIRVLDRYREVSGVPCILNAFNRSPETQERLQNDPRFAAAKFSPHVVFMAADINTNSAHESQNTATLLANVGKELGIVVRIGYKEYLNLAQPMTFVHVDVCPEYYAPGKPFHNLTHPGAWETAARW